MDQLIVNPMLNFLLFLYGLTGNFVLAITIFTILSRLVILPLTLSQQRNTQRMQIIQPQVQEIQAKYKHDPQKMQEELLKIGYSPSMLLSGCLPLIVQMGFLYGLWQAIQRVLAISPLDLLSLVQATYKIPSLVSLIPVQHSFLWLELGHYDPTYILPILVAVTTYFSQKALTPNMGAAADPTSAAMTRNMQLMMPLMLGYWALSFPSALSIYWVISNGMAIAQYYILQKTGLAPAPAPAIAGGSTSALPARSGDTSTPRRKIRSKVKK